MKAELVKNSLKVLEKFYAEKIKNEWLEVFDKIKSEQSSK